MDLTTSVQRRNKMHQFAKEDFAIPGYNEPQKMPKMVRLSFTINEKHLRLLDEATEDIKVRFNTMVAVEETAYASTESVNIRWVEIEGRDDTQAKFAKAYIEALCSPQHQQTFNYPILLHEDIAGKKDDLEHTYHYKAVVRFQQKGTLLVSGQADEVLMLVSVLEHEINQRRLQSMDYGEHYEQLPLEDLQSLGHSEDINLLGIHTVSQTDRAATDSGTSLTFPDFVSQTSQKMFTPHSGSRTSSQYQMGKPVAELHSSQVDHLPQKLKPIDPASSATHAQPFQSQVEFSNSQFVEEDLPNQDIAYRKPVHISTPPHSCVDLKRQRIDTGQQYGTVVTDCESRRSELNSSRLSTGSFKNSHRFELACNAAFRAGYTKQDVEEAIRALPQDWKTSELISTLNSRTRQQSSSDLFNAPCVQRHNTDSSRTVNNSLFCDEDSTGDKPLLSSQPLLLTSIISREPCGITETLRRRQQDLLKNLPQHTGRQSDIISIAATIPFTDGSIVTNTSSSIPAKNNALSTTTKQMTAVDYSNASQGVSELPMGETDDVIFLAVEQDMDCSVAPEYVENMEVENKDVEYIHTTFSENTGPDVLLLSTPKKTPELVIIDDENKQFHHQLTKSQKMRQQSSSQIPKRSLAPVFNMLQQVQHQCYPDNTSQSQYQDDLINDCNSPPHTSSYLHLGVISETKMQIESDSKQIASNSSVSVDKQSPLHTLTDEKNDLDWKNNSKDKIKTFSSVTKKLKNISNVPKQQLLPQANQRETVPLMKHLPLSAPEKSNSEQNNLHDIPNVKNKSIDLQQIKQEISTSDSLPEVQEIGVIELLRQFKEDFELKKEEFEKEVREKAVKETLDMVAEENEAIQRQNLHEKQKDDLDDKATIVTDQDIEEKLRIERKKVNEKQKKAIQKLGQQFREFKEKVLTESEGKLQEQYEKLMQQQREQLLQQRDEFQQQQLQEQQRLIKEQQEQFHKELQKMQRDMQKQQEQMKKQIEEHHLSRPVGTMAADVRAEKDVIVIKPSVKGTPSPFRPVVIDGSNVAMLHGKRNRLFSCRGIALCVQYFQNIGIKDITVFVPRWRQTQDAVRNDRRISNKQILDSLESKGILSFTPSRKVRGQYINSYDDRFIVKLATDNGGIIVSNDNFRDLMQESEEWKKVIETRLLMFTFAGDKFMIPDDPYGREGPTLVELLQRPKRDLTMGRMPPGGATQAAIKQQGGLNESQLKELSYNIGMEWEHLGTCLKFSHSEISKIRSNHPHNTDGAILHMLKTWNGRLRSDKTNRYGILAEALKHTGRVDLAELVLHWKINTQQGPSEADCVLQGPVVQGQGVDKRQAHGSETDWGQWIPVNSRQKDRRGAGVREGAHQAPDQHPQQTFGVRPKHNAPATLSTPPPVDIRTLPQYKTLIEMFPDKRDSIEKLLIDNPNCEDNYLLDMLL